jgi:hypothetical protein
VTTTTRFRDAREVKAWNDAMVVKYDLDRFHDHPSPLVRFVESRRVEVIFRLLDPRLLRDPAQGGLLRARN